MYVYDVDGDGLLDILTGKRRWAHGIKGDPEPNAPPVLYWFRLARDDKGAATYEPQRIDDDSGVGTQVTAGDVTGDGKPDVAVANKRGVFIFRQGRERPSRIDRARRVAAERAPVQGEKGAAGRRAGDGS